MSPILKSKEVKKIAPKTKGVISGSITKNWTTQAIYCYQSQRNCTECAVGSGNYSFVCQMPKVVKKLLKKVGEPEINEKIYKTA